MENFRSICFVYPRKFSYRACYLKQLFKLMGFTYFTYTTSNPNKKLEALQRMDNENFDIIVNLQENPEDFSSLPGFRVQKMVSLSLMHTEDELLEELMEKLYENQLKGYRQDLLKDMVRLYQEDHMVSYLYEYTCILLNKARSDIFNIVYQGFTDFLEKLKELGEKYAEETQFKEYYLYAMYSCQRKVNDLCRMDGKIPLYEVEDLLGKIDEIYTYDPKYSKVEYLKAKVVEKSITYKALGREFYDNCVQRCPVRICRGYMYYELGRWLNGNRQFYEAKRAYEYSYRTNRMNIKAIFKMAVNHKKLNEDQLAREYLDILIWDWESHTEEEKIWMPLMKLEYAYKAYMLLWDMEPRRSSGQKYFDKAEEVLEYTRKLGIRSKKEPCFVRSIYHSVGIDGEDICNLIRCRMDIKCEEIQGGYYEGQGN